MGRSVVFRGVYYTVSLFFAVLAMPLMLWPNRRPLMAWIRTYTRVMTTMMRRVGGIAVTVSGREHLPDGPFIIAAKHQSWGDGIVMFAQVPDLAFVSGDHMMRYPLIGSIFRKMGVIVVSNCGGPTARGRLMAKEMEKARAENRPVLIYPEGTLSPVGTKARYRKGVFHMYEAYNCPVVPVATDLGVRWPQYKMRLTPGPAHVEFLPPIAPGLDKKTFMADLERMIESRSLGMLDDQKTAGTWADISTEASCA